jgi:hypothetical protein
VISFSWWRDITLATLAVISLGGLAQAQAQAPPPTPDPAAAPPPPGTFTSFLYADASQEGVISLFFDAPGARVIYYEHIGNYLRRLGATQSEPGAQTVFREATTWSCVRVVRRFHATARLPDGRLAVGDYSVRTRSCDDRFDVRVPRRVAPGKVARVRVVDRWGIGGLRPVLCITPPGERPTCDTLAFPTAVAVATRRFRASERGRWRVDLRVRGHHERGSVQVGGGKAPAPPPILLATGDSTMQGVDSFLSADLGETVRVRSDVRPGFGVSKTNASARFASTQVTRLHPATTVVSIGGTEGATMRTPEGVSIECCEEPWIAEYSRRVRTMMLTYARRGRGRVLWLTQPAPATPALTLVTNAVNVGIVRAAEGLKHVTVLRMDKLFTPDGYSETIRYRGRTVHVRQRDGIHLNVAGTAIAATAIAQAVRAK